MTKADEGVAPTRVAPRISARLNHERRLGVAELTHELVREQLSEYLDDTLGEAARRRIDGHLAACPPCAAYLDTLRVTVRGAGTAAGAEGAARRRGQNRRAGSARAATRRRVRRGWPEFPRRHAVRQARLPPL